MNKKYESPTMYKNNSGFSAKLKVSKYKKWSVFNPKSLCVLTRYYSYTRPLYAI